MKTVGRTVFAALARRLVDDKQTRWNRSSLPQKEDDDDACRSVPSEEMLRVMCEEIDTRSGSHAASRIRRPWHRRLPASSHRRCIVKKLCHTHSYDQVLACARVEEITGSNGPRTPTLPPPRKSDERCRLGRSGLRCQSGKLEAVIRVWTTAPARLRPLYLAEGVLEGGNTVVTSTTRRPLRLWRPAEHRRHHGTPCHAPPLYRYGA